MQPRWRATGLQAECPQGGPLLLAQACSSMFLGFLLMQRENLSSAKCVLCST